MRRGVMIGIILLLLLGVMDVAAGLTPPRIMLSRVEPAVEAVRGGSTTSVELRNPQKELVLLDQQGKAWLRMSAEGVYELNQKGNWEEVRKEPFYYIADGEVGRFTTDRSTMPYPWTIRGTYGGQPFVMTGTLIPAGTKFDPYGNPVESKPMAVSWGAIVGWTFLIILVAGLVIGGATVWLVGRRNNARSGD